MPGRRQLARRGLDRAAWWIATGLGSGYAPLAPGTAGTVVGAGLYWWGLKSLDPMFYLIALLGLVALATVAAQRIGTLSGSHDPGFVTVDEIVGLLTAMAFIRPSLTALGLGFALFRCFDILKPAWVKRMERLPGGLGVVMDDFVAGVLANLSLRLLLFLVFDPPASFAIQPPGIGS